MLCVLENFRMTPEDIAQVQKKKKYGAPVVYIMEFGSDAAIILSNIEYWVMFNASKNKNFKNGRFWTYNSSTSFQKYFPWMEPSKIRREILKLRKAEVLLTGEFNKLKGDRTLWYTINYKVIKTLEQKWHTPILQIWNTPCDKNEQPIPDNKLITNNKQSTSKEVHSVFEKTQDTFGILDDSQEENKKESNPNNKFMDPNFSTESKKIIDMIKDEFFPKIQINYTKPSKSLQRINFYLNALRTGTFSSIFSDPKVKESCQAWFTSENIVNIPFAAFSWDEVERLVYKCMRRSQKAGNTKNKTPGDFFLNLHFGNSHFLYHYNKLSTAAISDQNDIETLKKKIPEKFLTRLDKFLFSGKWEDFVLEPFKKDDLLWAYRSITELLKWRDNCLEDLIQHNKDGILQLEDKTAFLNMWLYTVEDQNSYPHPAMFRPDNSFFAKVCTYAREDYGLYLYTKNEMDEIKLKTEARLNRKIERINARFELTDEEKYEKTYTTNYEIACGLFTTNIPEIMDQCTYAKHVEILKENYPEEHSEFHEEAKKIADQEQENGFPWIMTGEFLGISRIPKYLHHRLKF